MTKKNKIIIIVCVIIVIIGGGYLFVKLCGLGDKVDEASKVGSEANRNWKESIGSSTTTTKANKTTTTTTTEVDSTKAKYVIVLSNLMSLIKEGKAFDTGDYVKGDIPKGEYAFVALSSGSKYYSEEDASGNIIDNENFDAFGYVKVHGKGDLTTRGVLVGIDSLSALGVSGAKELYEILNETSDYNESGFYKIGYDLPAGSYKLESYGSAYYAVLSGPVGSSDIVRNDNFNGKKTVTVKNGQYLEVHRAEISKN